MSSSSATAGTPTYHSLLKNFGLLGFAPFVGVLLLGPVAARRGSLAAACLAGFLLIFLAAQAVSFISAGNGSNPTYFLTLGAGRSL